MKTPPTADRLRHLLDDMGISVRDLLRKNVPPYEALGLADPKWTPLGVRLCRPSELVLDIIPIPAIGHLTKEYGEVVLPKTDATKR